ncbi:MAG: hypothetical protein AAGG68_29075 [Bacteroidota bacterium]
MNQIHENETSNSSKSPNFDRSDLIAILALFISVLGTIVAFRETSILSKEQEMNQRNQAASVWPYLDTSYSYDYRDSLYTTTMILENKGVGPALLNKAELVSQTDTFTFGQAANYLNALTGTTAFFQLQSTDIGSGIISAGDRVQLLKITGKTDQISFPEFQAAFNQFQLSLCYCSVYQQCWRYNAGTWASVTEDCEVGVAIY